MSKLKLTDPKKVQELTDRYEEYLDEIVDRLWVAIHTSQELVKGSTINQYRTIDIDLCHLQVRKAFECIAFASLLAHRIVDRNMDRKIEKEYHAGKILAYLRRINPKFFPEAVRVYKDENGVNHIERIDEIKGTKVLSQSSYMRTYNQICGLNLHSSHQYSRDLDGTHEKEARKIHETAMQAICLLGTHTIQLGPYKILAGINDKPFATLLTPINASKTKR